MISKRGSDAGPVRLMNMLFQLFAVVVMTYVVFTLISSAMSPDDEAIIAKDLGLTIETLQFAEGNINMNYLPDTSDYVITIDREKVVVDSENAKRPFRLNLIKGIQVTETIISNKISVPLLMDAGRISFEPQAQYITESLCDSINVNVDKDADVSVIISSDDKQRGNLEKIFRLLKTYLPAIEQSSSGDIVIVLKSAKEGSDIRISKYNSVDDKTYEKIACIIEDKVIASTVLNKDFVANVNHQSNNIILELNDLDTKSIEEYAKIISDTIKEVKNE